MHIGYLTHYFYPETGAPAARAYDLSRAWNERGCRVSVLTSLPNHPEGRIRKAYRGHWSVTEVVDGVRVYRRWLIASARRTPLSVLATQGSFALHALGAAVAEAAPRPDLWIASSPPLFMGAAGVLVAQLQEVPLVLEVRDLWPDYFAEMGVIRNRAILSLLYHLESFIYRNSSVVITVADTARRRLIEQKGLADNRVFFLPNGVDLQAFASETGEGTSMRRELGLDGKFVVGYIGNHGLGQRLETVIDAAAMFVRDPEVHFLFVGDGAEKQKVVGRSRSLGLGNVTFLSTCAREDVPAFYKAADVCLVPLADVPSFRNTIPSKLFEILGCARPVVGALAGEGAEVIELSGGGVVVPPENPRLLAEAIARLRSFSHERLEEIGLRGRQYVEEHFNRAELAQRYLSILEGVLARHVGNGSVGTLGSLQP